jgi:hypothetical protein
VPFIIYADKNKLSSFGTAVGHPIIARLANMPVSIRNSEAIGGGSIVGWLPLVSSIKLSKRYIDILTGERRNG